MDVKGREVRTPKGLEISALGELTVYYVLSKTVILSVHGNMSTEANFDS
jgi:hypothetical protein